jgi:hypothetical protein
MALFTYTGILGATITILITTLDDCVWLVPYLSPSRYSRSVCIQHGIIFAITFISLTSIIGLCTNYIISFQSTTNTTTSFNYERMMELFGVLLCWILALYYYYRSWRKQRQRQRRQAEEEARAKTMTSIKAAVAVQPTNDGSTILSTSNNYGSCSTEINNHDNDTAQNDRSMDHDDNNNNNETISLSQNDNNIVVSSEIQLYTIITLTISGALDEVSYFPSLLIGHLYTFTELLMGTVFTVCIMLLVVTQLLHRCRPILQCLDRIPLYGIITVYALLLTINLIVDTYV